MTKRLVSILALGVALYASTSFAKTDCNPYETISANGDYLARQVKMDPTRRSAPYTESVEAYYKIYDRLLIAHRIGDAAEIDRISGEFKECTGDEMKKKTLTWGMVESSLSAKDAAKLKRELEEAYGEKITAVSVLKNSAIIGVYGGFIALIPSPLGVTQFVGAITMAGSGTIAMGAAAVHGVTSIPVAARATWFRWTGHEDRVALHKAARELAMNQVESSVGTSLLAPNRPAIESQGVR